MTNARLEELRIKFQENPRRYFAPFANELRKAGDATQAIAICRAQIAGQPGHVSGHIVLGQALYEAAETAEASNVFTAALELDPENLIALRSMGEIAQVNGDFQSARHWYERLLEADPRNAEVVQLLRDLPTESAADATRSFAPPVDTEVPPEAALPPAAIEEATPPPPSGFHTTYTGVAVAYQPRDRWEPPAEIPEAAPTTEPSADLAADLEDRDAITAAHEPTEVRLESEAAAAEPPRAEPVEAGFSAIEQAAAAIEPAAAEAAQADAEIEADIESFITMPAGQVELSAPVEMSAELDVDLVSDVETAGLAEAEASSGDVSTEEPPRALFAEHGFEGDVQSRDAWITPSAAYSDLEAAPEDWFAEPAEASEPESHSLAAAEAEPQGSAIDSWFDEGPAATTESDEAGSEEYWMPDFAGVSQTGAAMDAAPAAEFEAQPASPDEIAIEATAQEADATEPPRVVVEAFGDVAIDAVLVDHPAAAEAMALPHFDQGSPVVGRESAPEYAVEFEEVVTSEAMSAAPDLPEDAPVMAESGAEPQFAEEAPATAAAEYPDPTVGHTPSFSPAIPAPAPAPFVTETLAELYLQQGFRDEALAIYRQLADRDPSDPSLRIRIAAIEQGEASDVMKAADAPVVPRPTVRAFFSKLAHRAPVAPVVDPEPAGALDVPFAAAASALANLFAASKPPAADEGAAATLSSAFTDPAGRPSRATDRELSLDHLFRDVPSGGQGASGVKLDEFYATSLPATQPGAPTPSAGEAAGPEGEGTDIRQFTAWLEGLRKK